MVDHAALAEDLCRRYAPGAPDTAIAAAASMVEQVLKAGSRGAVTLQSGLDGEQLTSRDPGRAEIVRRSGAASVLASWRRPRGLAV